MCVSHFGIIKMKAETSRDVNQWGMCKILRPLHLFPEKNLYAPVDIIRVHYISICLILEAGSFIAQYVKYLTREIKKYTIPCTTIIWF